MKQHSCGLHVPNVMEGPARYIEAWTEMAPVIKPPHFGSVVQAGGHIGIFPRELAKIFKRVYTFEPDHANFECLMRNASAQNIYANRAALGATTGCKRLEVHPRSTGGHQMTHDHGAVPTYKIDALGLTNCGLVLLDLEGFEFFALLGATDTIIRCQPQVIVEQNKKARGRGFQPGAIELLMNSLDYRQRGTVGENLIFEPVQRAS